MTQLRLKALLATASACLLIWAAPLADAAYYAGGGHDIRVQIRVKHHKVVYARVATKLYCINGSERFRHKKPLRFYFGVGLGPSDATDAYTDDLPIRNGHFTYEENVSEETGSIEGAFQGHVLARRISGTFRYDATYDEDCRTGGYQRYGGVNQKRETLRFHLSRR
jgi:hypothetical protein